MNLKILQILILIALLAVNATTYAATNPLSKSVNHFNWNYFRTLDKTKNIFYSPYSIAAAFSIVANGATGQTQKEILNALSSKSIDNLNADFKTFRDFVEKNYRSGTILNQSDLILVNKDYLGSGINAKFRKIVEGNYRAELDDANFENPSAEVERIRNWVSKTTNAFIPNYEAAVDADTIIDILDVIYFKGRWENPFDSYKTWKSDFTNCDGSKSKVQMMSKTFDGSLAYYADEKYMAIALPYQNNLAAMYVILPRSENDLDVAADWDAEDIYYREDFLSNLRAAPIFDGKVEVFIPKFELDVRADLNAALQEMGINRAFTDNAEFFNIVKKAQLKISQATHQAKVRVDETGTEAAAVTEITMVGVTMADTPKQTIYFRADRPFLFVIRDVQSEVSLFTGAVNKLQ